MEKFSSCERVVGKLPEEIKKQILNDTAAQFNDQIFEELKGRERDKTPEELRIIDLANNASNELMKKYGLDNFNIPADNIHIFKENEWPKEEHGDAFYNSGVQAIAVREQPARIVFMRKIFHEMLHFKSYHALQATIEQNPEITDYRLGLTVNTRDGKERYFTNLNEAITEELTKKFVINISKEDFFSQEVNQTKSIMNKNPAAKSDSNKPLFTEDTLYAEIGSNKSWREALGRILGRRRIFTERFTYQKERDILNVLMDKIFERSREKFNSKDDVFEVFARGTMTGNILPLGRLVDGTFGKGTLRSIGELDKDIKKQAAYVQSL